MFTSRESRSLALSRHATAATSIFSQPGNHIANPKKFPPSASTVVTGQELSVVTPRARHARTRADCTTDCVCVVRCWCAAGQRSLSLRGGEAAASQAASQAARPPRTDAQATAACSGATMRGATPLTLALSLVFAAGTARGSHAAAAVPTVEIAPGVHLPMINDGVSNRSVWISKGGTGLDTALSYGDSDQQGVGRSIRASGRPRSDFFVTTKVRSPKLTVGLSQSSYISMAYRVVGAGALLPGDEFRVGLGSRLPERRHLSQERHHGHGAQHPDARAEAGPGAHALALRRPQRYRGGVGSDGDDDSDGEGGVEAVVLQDRHTQANKPKTEDFRKQHLYGARLNRQNGLLALARRTKGRLGPSARF